MSAPAAALFKKSRRPGFGGFSISEPFLDPEDRDRDEGESCHKGGMDPKSVGIVAEGDLRAHREHIGVHRHGEQDGGENREHFHREVELVGEEGIVGRFERLDGLFLALQDIPEADIGADEVLKIDFDSLRDERMVFLDDGLEYRALGFQGAAEVEDVALQYGNLEHHLFFLFREDLCFDGIEFLADVIEAGEAGVQEKLYQVVQEVRRRGIEEQAAFPLASFEAFEELGELVDVLPMTRDEMIVRQDDVELARIGRPVLDIEEGNVDRKKQTAVVLDDFRLVGRRDELFYRQRMDVEVLLQIGDVVILRVFEIDPRDASVSDGFHRISLFLCVVPWFV